MTDLREAYRRADLRLRILLFGDTEHFAGRLRGEEPRQQASAELRRMRSAFDEAVDAAEALEGDEPSSLPDDLVKRAVEAEREQRDQSRTD